MRDGYIGPYSFKAKCPEDQSRETNTASRRYKILEAFAEHAVDNAFKEGAGLSFYDLTKPSGTKPSGLRIRSEFVLTQLKQFHKLGYLKIIEKKKLSKKHIKKLYSITAKGVFSLLYPTSIHRWTGPKPPGRLYAKERSNWDVLFPDDNVWQQIDHLAKGLQSEYWLFDEWDELERLKLPELARYLLLSAVYLWNSHGGHLPTKDLVVRRLIGPLSLESSGAGYKDDFTVTETKANRRMTKSERRDLEMLAGALSPYSTAAEPGIVQWEVNRERHLEPLAGALDLDSAWYNVAAELSRESLVKLREQARTYLRSDSGARASVGAYLNHCLEVYEGVVKEIRGLMPIPDGPGDDGGRVGINSSRPE